MPVVEQVQIRASAEQRYAHELAALAERDREQGAELPPGWRLSARAVRDFVVGDPASAG